MTTTENTDPVATDNEIEIFKEFVLTFGDNLQGDKAISNYAEFSGFDKSTISRAINGKGNIHPAHFTIMRLVNDREEAKAESRELRKEIKNTMVSVIKLVTSIKGIK